MELRCAEPPEPLLTTDNKGFRNIVAYIELKLRNYSVFYIVWGYVMEVRWFRYAPSAAGSSQNTAFLSGNPFDEQ